MDVVRMKRRQIYRWELRNTFQVSFARCYNSRRTKSFFLFPPVQTGKPAGVQINYLARCVKKERERKLVPYREFESAA